ncbi:uridine kinase [Cyclonatronum proteinivorum]|uniref:Uridine kinase n=1 Tax=Cyclonatronum proteinivorum TaxID=1457365 RepID=A0A345ULX4_9BACT|nr:uridine kinase [Cyclonatronum proteinivorum]AXJ01476.1 uridine kinase [Cyclonatronum proteinivorum]
MKPFVIGVAGGSGSGKTTVVSHIIDAVGSENLVLLQHDSYYRDLKHLSFEQRVRQNFDHPAALETELLIRHVNALLSGYSIKCPIYDFKNHVRSENYSTYTPKPIILVDGILIFYERELRDLMNIKIFVDTDDDLRLLRRLKRDINDRGRSVDSVLNQYEKFVRPMHLEFVEPSKRYADIIIPHGGQNKVALDILNSFISEKVSHISEKEAEVKEK